MTDAISTAMASNSPEAPEIMLPPRRTPVYRSVDVLVCGGGRAGAAAAVAAAREGADTLLVERNVVLGGNGPLSFQIGLRAASRGISGEICERLSRTGDLGADEMAIDGSPVHDPEAFKYVLLDLVREAGAGLLLSSWACAPMMRDGAVVGVFVENKSGRFAIPAHVVVDATGDADLAVRAGAIMREPAEPPALRANARIGGIDFDRALAGRKNWPALIADAKRKGQLAAAQPDTISLYGVTERARHRRMAFLSGSSITGRSATNAEDLTAAEIEARALLRQYIAFLKTVSGFEESFLVDVAGAIGVTRSRHIEGDRMLTLADIGEGRTGADDAGAAQDGFGVSLGCLLPSGIDNLLVTGRAASIEDTAFARFRQSIDSAALGEAAGLAAATAAKAGCSLRAISPQCCAAPRRARETMASS
jgi:hypothetical protein